MLTLDSSYNSFDASLTSGNLLTSLEGLYTSLRKIMGRALLLVLATLFLLPFAFALGLWFKKQRSFFLKTMRNDNQKLNTVEDYVSFRENLDQLGELKSKLSKLKTYNLKNAPWGVSFLLNQMQKTSSTLLQYYSWNEEKLADFNKPRVKSSSHFVFVSENELWENRNPAYSYWM